MHKLVLSLLILPFASLVACNGGEDSRGKTQAGGLTAAEYDRLLSLNRMQQDNIDAREAAHRLVTPSLNEKSRPMSEKMAFPNCVKNGEIPDSDLTGQIHEQTIAGAAGNTCPVYWYRRRGWTVANKIMVMADNLEVHDAEYRKSWSPMAVRSMSGSYKIIPEERGFRVAGAVTINNFQTTDYGRITGGIAVNFTSDGDTGLGSIVLSLNGGRWANTASVQWRVRNGTVVDPTYRIGNVKTDKPQFDLLFSAYELDKYMDNAVNMK